jgi:hypothetical protein
MLRRSTFNVSRTDYAYSRNILSRRCVMGNHQATFQGVKSYTPEELRQLELLSDRLVKKLPFEFRLENRKNMTNEAQLDLANRLLAVQLETIQAASEAGELSDRLASDCHRLLEAVQPASVFFQYYIPEISDPLPYLLRWVSKWFGRHVELHVLCGLQKGVVMHIPGNPLVRRVIVSPALECFCQEKGQVAIFHPQLPGQVQKRIQSRLMRLARTTLGTPYALKKIFLGWAGHWFTQGTICTEFVLNIFKNAGIPITPAPSYLSLYKSVGPLVWLWPLLIPIFCCPNLATLLWIVFGLAYGIVYLNYYLVVSAFQIAQGKVTGQNLKLAFSGQRGTAGSWSLLRQYLSCVQRDRKARQIKVPTPWVVTELSRPSFLGIQENPLHGFETGRRVKS